MTPIHPSESPGSPPLAAQLAALESGWAWRAPGDAQVILVRGPDALEFLNGLVTCDMTRLEVGELQRGLVCDTKGKITQPLALARVGEEAFVLLPEPDEGGQLGAHLEFNHVRETVEIGRLEHAPLEVWGPEGPATLGKMGLPTPTSANRAGAGGEDANRAGENWAGTRAGGKVFAFADPVGTLPRVRLLTPQAEMAGLLEGLEARGGVHLDAAAVAEAHLWARAPLWKRDFQAGNFPAEAGLQAWMSFAKGCYIGQEFHARMQHRGHPNKTLVACRWVAAEGLDDRVAGARVYSGASEVGRLTGVSVLTLEGFRVGMALVSWPIAQAGMGAPAGTGPQAGLTAGEKLALEPGGPAVVEMGAVATHKAGGR